MASSPPRVLGFPFLLVLSTLLSGGGFSVKPNGLVIFPSSVPRNWISGNFVGGQEILSNLQVPKREAASDADDFKLKLPSKSFEFGDDDVSMIF